MPPSQGQAHLKSKRGNVGWWVAAGVAALVIVVLVVVLLQGSRQPVVTPSPSPTSESTVQETTELGEFAPTYQLRALSTLEFPATLDAYAMVSDYALSLVRTADYEKVEGLGLFTAMVTLEPSEFEYRVQHFADPVLMGNAVCGVTSEDGVLKECVMAGADGSIIINTAGDTMTLEELARIIQAFYALP